MGKRHKSKDKENLRGYLRKANERLEDSIVHDNNIICNILLL